MPETPKKTKDLKVRVTEAWKDRFDSACFVSKMSMQEALVLAAERWMDEVERTKGRAVIQPPVGRAADAAPKGRVIGTRILPPRAGTG